MWTRTLHRVQEGNYTACWPDYASLGGTSTTRKCGLDSHADPSRSRCSRYPINRPLICGESLKTWHRCCNRLHPRIWWWQSGVWEPLTGFLSMLVDASVGHSYFWIISRLWWCDGVGELGDACGFDDLRPGERRKNLNETPMLQTLVFASRQKREHPFWGIHQFIRDNKCSDDCETYR